MVVAALGLLTASRVDLGHVAGQFQGYPELSAVELELSLALGQRFVGGVQFALELVLLALEQARRDRLLREAHIQELVLAGFQTLDELALGLLDMPQGILADSYQSIDCCAAPAHLLGAELDGTLAVVALDGRLDQLGTHVDPLGAAVALDPPDAEEVGVLAPVFAGALGVNQPFAALVAVDAAAQVVAGSLGALPSHPLFIQQRLYAVEGVLVDQRLMPTVEYLLVRRATLVDDLPGVVAVAQ